MTIRGILPRISIFVTLALLVCAAPPLSAAQMKKDDNAKQIAVQWVNALMKTDDEGVRRTTRLPLYFDDMAPLTDTKQVASAFMAALTKMVRPGDQERVGLRPGSPRSIVDFLTGEKGPPSDQMLKSMSVSKEDLAVPVLVIQGGKRIGTLLIVVRDSKVARVFTA
jgi:hypothetical protein